MRLVNIVFLGCDFLDSCSRDGPKSRDLPGNTEGGPALASAEPKRMAKKHDSAGRSSSQIFRGPLTRASRLLSSIPTRS